MDWKNDIEEGYRRFKGLGSSLVCFDYCCLRKES